MLRYGYCAEPGSIGLIADLGYDYVELALSGIAAMEPGKLQELGEELSSAGVRAEVLNILLPGSIHIADESYSPAQCREYLAPALERASALGTEVIVFGSGKSKMIPDGFDRDRAMEQIVDFTRLTSELFLPYGMTAVIEPLRAEECNVINTIAEADLLRRRAGRDNVQLLADLYHMQAIGDTPEDMAKAGEHLRHAHIACPGTRAVPVAGDGYDYLPFFAALHRMGYSHRVSFEGAAATDLPAQAAACLALMKELEQRASAL